MGRLGHRDRRGAGPRHEIDDALAARRQIDLLDILARSEPGREIRIFLGARRRREHETDDKSDMFEHVNPRLAPLKQATAVSATS